MFNVINIKFERKKIFSNLRPNISLKAKIEARPTFESRPKICLGPTFEPKLRPGQLCVQANRMRPDQVL